MFLVSEENYCCLGRRERDGKLRGFVFEVWIILIGISEIGIFRFLW